MRRHLTLIVFTALYMLGFTAYAISRGNGEFVFYAIVMVVLIAGVSAMHRRVKFSPSVLWLLAIWGLLHMAGGNVPVPARLAPDWAPPAGATNPTTVLYNMRAAPWLPKYDQFVHAFGFACATLASFEALRACIRSMKPGAPTVPIGLAIACFLIGMGLGAMNEVVEFTATRFMNTNVGGYENTGWDLVSNMTGSLAAALWVWISNRARPR